MENLLEVRHLTYAHPDGTRALDEVSFSVKSGENLAIFGPNGSGKTTLLLHLNGILRGSGSVQIAGQEVTAHTLAEVRRRVGLVFQDPDHQLFMPTVLEDVMFGPLNLGWTVEQAEEKACRMLAEVGIQSGLFKRPPFHLSAGEKRRVALAGVLVMEPEILLLDEPTTSLDPPGQAALTELLQGLPQAKIVATHEVNFARAIARRAIFLEKGRLIAEGELDRIAETFRWNLYC